jgi:hypothetical protein
MPWNLLLWRGSIFVRLAKTIYRIKDGPAVRRLRGRFGCLRGA